MGEAPVDGRWCLVHATHVNDAELAEMVARGAVAGLCPITEANLGDGLFPAAAFLDAGGAIGVGSDSNVLIDAAEELRLLEYGQRLRGEARNVLSSRSRPSAGGRLFRAAQAGGARALAGTAGSLAVGEPLDVVALDGDHPALVARRGDARLDGWLFAAGRGAVDKVWRRGRLVVREGRHVDRRAIRARYARTLRRVLES
jgi:formiminoglutamate deiminase